MSAHFNKRAVERLAYFVAERERVRLAKDARRPKPWTLDPILQRYRFTNVHREYDKVTRWIAAHIREPFHAHPHLWFMLCIARVINEPEVLAELMRKGKAWPLVNWEMRTLASVLRNRATRGEKITTGVYMITTHGSTKPKPDYIAENYLLPLWQYRAQIKPQLELKGQTLEGAYETLVRFPGWGDFLVGQVVADLKYTRYLRRAPDWHRWAVLGPGSKRGLQRVLGEEQHVEDVVDALLALQMLLPKTSATRGLCLQDLQNCLCEFDKYERERLGEGHPRNRYNGIS